MADWIDRLIYRYLLRNRTDELLASLRTAYEDDTPLPAAAQAAINEAVANFEPPQT